MFLRPVFLFSSLRSCSTFRVGGFSGFWGDSPRAADRLLQHGNLDYLTGDYLSEVTMSLLNNPKEGKKMFVPDFCSDVLTPANVAKILEKGTKVIVNAGGLNPLACAKAVSETVTKVGGGNLNIGVVVGDDLSHMEGFKKFNSANAYLGAWPIVECLKNKADIVITGRCVDSALTLAPFIYECGLQRGDLDSLALGSAAGHLIECGAQVSGGISTDWATINNMSDIAYPLIDCRKDASSFTVSKLPGDGGMVNRGTVLEQMFYEVGDPTDYQLPDVRVDFSDAEIVEQSDNCVRVSNIHGNKPPSTLKVSTTSVLHSRRCTAVALVSGGDAVGKARKTAQAIIDRCGSICRTAGLPSAFAKVEICVIGAGDQYGATARELCGFTRDKWLDNRDVAVWISVHGPPSQLKVFRKEIAPAGTSMCPGFTFLVGGRPKIGPVFGHQACFVDKSDVPVFTGVFKADRVTHDTDLSIDLKKGPDYEAEYASETKSADFCRNFESNEKEQLGDDFFDDKTLGEIAFLRSGDKGDSCNVAVIARKRQYWSFIRKYMTPRVIAAFFENQISLKHATTSRVDCVKRFDVEKLAVLNFVIADCLGGGGMASLRPDPQGKAFAQMLSDVRLKSLREFSSLS